MNCEVDDFRALRAALERMCAALEEASVPENAVFDCKLVASELLCNALRYGGGSAAFAAEARDGEVVIRVRSANNFRPPEHVSCSAVDSERGRGLFLVDALTVSRTYSEEDGVCVVIRIG
ncbi:MAG TPA: ATP-binding protein [Firmicutes bacterium]|nr:ATP-binding protein [Bacillota bacterium]